MSIIIEFIKSLNFGSNVKKLQFSFFSNFSVICHFLFKNLFSWIKKSLILNGIYSNRSKLDPSNETIRTQNWLKKNCWKWPKSLRCRKAYNSQAIRDTDSKYWYHKLRTRMKVVSKFHIPILYTFPEISRQIALRLGQAVSSF